MALAKIVGFEVTPRTPWPTSSARRPLVRNARLRLSIQGLWPCWSKSSCSLVIGHPLFPLMGLVTACRRSEPVPNPAAPARHLSTLPSRLLLTPSVHLLEQGDRGREAVEEVSTTHGTELAPGQVDQTLQGRLPAELVDDIALGAGNGQGVPDGATSLRDDRRELDARPEHGADCTADTDRAVEHQPVAARAASSRGHPADHRKARVHLPDPVDERLDRKGEGIGHEEEGGGLERHLVGPPGDGQLSTLLDLARARPEPARRGDVEADGNA